MEYGGPYTLTFTTETASVSFCNIYIGEVFLFAGQSNMELKLKETNTDPASYESNKNVRLFAINGRHEKSGYHYYAADKWSVCEKEAVGEWSAIGYFTGLELAKAKDIAVGVITCAQGASIIESWVPAGTFEKSGIEIPFQQAHPEEDLSSLFKWNIAGLLYEQAFLQVVPFSVSAVVWYQGESDTYLQEAKVYKQELAVLIDTWRTDLDNRNLPFIIIQLADYQSTLNSEGWKLVQQAQLDIQQEHDNVMSVVCADVCETDNIHPPTKDKLSKRVAAAIESFVLNN